MTYTTVQSLWIGKRLPPYLHLSIRAFQKLGMEYVLYLYEEIADVPAGVTVRRGQEILPASRIFAYARGPGRGSFSAFSNLFRYTLLFQKGGWWVDADIIPLRVFPTAERVYASERKRRFLRSGVQAASCVIFEPPGSPLMEACIEAIRGADLSRLKWGEIGPRLLHRKIQELGLQSDVWPPDAFCPVDYWDYDRFLEERPLSLEGCYAVHLWNEMWRRSGSHAVPSVSWLGRMYAKHGLSPEGNLL